MLLRRVWMIGLLSLAACPTQGPLTEVQAVAPLFGRAIEDTAYARVDADARMTIQLSDTVWKLAELAFQEHHSCKLLADTLEKGGFTVRRGVAGLKTGFVAEYGKGR